jgi:two-component system chemotaxis response regulator CheY
MKKALVEMGNPVMTAKRVLNVGQCGMDHASISAVLHARFGAETVAVHSQDEAIAMIRQGTFALVLVNRLFDADGSPGLELIKSIKGDPALAPIPVMLVSNFEDAQQQAARVGAVPGFGKAALGKADMLTRVEPFLRPA